MKLMTYDIHIISELPKNKLGSNFCAFTIKRNVYSINYAVILQFGCT